MIRTTTRSMEKTRRTVPLLLGTALLPLVLGTAATAQQTTSSPTTGGAVTVTPGSGARQVNRGIKVAVVAATDTSGNVEIARRALAAASNAITRWHGYELVPASRVSSALNKLNLRSGFNGYDMMRLSSSTDAAQLLTVTVSPGEATAGAAAYTAVVELYSGATGALIGRGTAALTAEAQANATGTGGAPAAAATASTASATAEALQAVEAAADAAAGSLNNPLLLSGIVITRPAAYTARISLGERDGLRNGAMLEYVVGDQVVATGTVYNLGFGEALASIAPEASAGAVMVNGVFRTVSNPAPGRAGKSQRQLDDEGWRKFERQFGLASAIALGYYYYVYGDF